MEGCLHYSIFATGEALQPAPLSIADLFQQREQYLIPLFQRGYVWTLTHQVQPLWEDVVDRLDAQRQHREDAAKISSKDKLKPLRKHFLGAIVVGSPVSFDTEIVATREVIDGQQRITTLQIMLLALRDLLKVHPDDSLSEDVGLLTSNKGRYRQKSDHLKIWPTNVGRDVVQALADAGSFSEVCKRFPVKGPAREKIERPLMVQAYLFFYAMLSCLIRGKRFDDGMPDTEFEDEHTIARAVIRSIEKDNVVSVPYQGPDVNLECLRELLSAFENAFQIMRLQLGQEDDPQIIFETLNARGAPLQPSDLVRNFVFLRASRNGEVVDDLYKKYWQDFDERVEPGLGSKGAKFWKKEERQGRLKSSRLDLLIYHYVGLRKREALKVAHVFEEFKTWWESEARDTDMELQRISVLARHFQVCVAPDQKTRFGLFCRRMQLLDTSTQTPLLFHLLEHQAPDSPEFLAMIGDMESYFVRRFICGLTTKAYNRIFLDKLLAEMVAEKKADPATLRAKLLELEGDSQLWPNDDAFKTAWSRRQLYEGRSTRKVRAVLEALEFKLRTSRQEFVPELDSLSVEHVLPQQWKPEDYPLPADTPEAKEARARLLHSIGNLTLVTSGFNSELSNKAFKVKRPELAANSSLMLNSYFQHLKDEDSWDEMSIVARADSLFGRACMIWPYPS
jgi:hypothetical protein